MSSAMELNQDTLQQIGEYVKKHLPEWQRESGAASGAGPGGAGTEVSAAYVHRTIDLGERIVRVEEELKTQRDLIREGFAETARRFEEQTAYFDKRFQEQTANFNARFEDFNRRFEEQAASVNKRFEEQTANFNTRFEEQAASINRRFDDVNKRFEDVNKRFDDVNRRFEDMQKHTNRWMMLISLFLAVIGAMPWIMGAY